MKSLSESCFDDSMNTWRVTNHVEAPVRGEKKLPTNRHLNLQNSKKIIGTPGAQK